MRSVRARLKKLEAARPPVCPVCQGRPWRIKMYQELPDGTTIDEPGFESQADEPDPCPRCTPPGMVTQIVIVIPPDKEEPVEDEAEQQR